MVILGFLGEVIEEYPPSLGDNHSGILGEGAIIPHREIEGAKVIFYRTNKNHGNEFHLPINGKMNIFFA